MEESDEVGVKIIAEDEVSLKVEVDELIDGD